MSELESIRVDADEDEPVPLRFLKLGLILPKIVLIESASKDTVESIIGIIEDLTAPKDGKKDRHILGRQTEIGEITLRLSGYFGDQVSNPRDYAYHVKNEDPELVGIDINKGEDSPAESYAVLNNGRHLVKKQYLVPFEDDLENSSEKTYTIMNENAASDLLEKLRSLIDQ
jgi:hypothetical protein